MGARKRGKTVAASRQGEREFRRKVRVVFQDPYRSLNPRLTVGASIAEGPLNFGISRKQAHSLAAELMEMVKLSPGALGRYPHEFLKSTA